MDLIDPPTRRIGRDRLALRYSPAMQMLHWVMAVLIFAVLPLAWAMVNLPRTAPHRELVYTVHKSVGLTILVLAVLRLILRKTRPIPPEPAGTPRWMIISAVTSHWLLYCILFAMPISGYVLSAAGGNEISYFGLFDLPTLATNRAVARIGAFVHLTLQWAIYALIALHLSATAWHVVVRRDGLLDREIPEQYR